MIGILIVAHGTLGESLIHCASHVMGKRPLYLRQLGVTIHDDPDAILPQGRDLVRFLDQGKGVLVMTDISAPRRRISPAGSLSPVASKECPASTCRC